MLGYWAVESWVFGWNLGFGACGCRDFGEGWNAADFGRTAAAATCGAGR